jgi:hypothetical protein
VRGGDLGGGGEAGAKLVGPGESRVTTTLKSLASSVPVVLRGGDAGGAQDGLIADQGDVAFEDRPGRASTLTSAGWPIWMLTMSVSSTLTSAVMTLMSARVISVEPSAFWMPTTTVSPSRTGRLVTMPSKGATETVCRARPVVAQRGLVVGDLGRGGFGLRLGLDEAALDWSSVATARS